MCFDPSTSKSFSEILSDLGWDSLVDPVVGPTQRVECPQGIRLHAAGSIPSTDDERKAFACLTLNSIANNLLNVFGVRPAYGPKVRLLAAMRARPARANLAITMAGKINYLHSR